MRLLFLLTFLFCFCISCKKQEPEFPKNAGSYIIEGYLFAGEQIRNIKVTEVVSSNPAENKPVTDAVVKVKWNQNTFDLSPIPDSPGFYYDSDNSIPILAEAQYELIVNRHGVNIASATTTVPLPVTGLQSTARDSMEINPANPLEKIFEVAWKEVNPLTEYVIFDNFAPDADEIIYYTLEEIPTDNPFNHISTNTFQSFHAYHFKNYGWHKVYITSSEPSFGAFYTTGISPFPNSSTETNIINATGIFTSFNGATIEFFLY